MTYIWQVSVIGSLAGVLGTGLGGLLIALFGKPHRTVLGFLLAFSGGIMLTVVCRDLLPEALALGNPFSTLAGLCGGIAAMFALNHVVPHIHPNSQESRAFLRIGLLIGVGIAMHNFPEGLAIGAGYAASDSLGLGLAIALALHNIPEGMAMAGPLIAGKVAPLWTALWTAAAGLPMGLGAFAGALFGEVSTAWLSAALGAARGAMLYLVFHELLPQSHTLNRPATTYYGAVTGIIVGFLL
mgnify:FL=1